VKPQTAPAQAHASNHQAPALQPGIGFSGAQHFAGNLAVQRLFNAGALQAKLSVSQPDDPYEQEADHLADRIMRMPEPANQHACSGCSNGTPLCSQCAGKQELRIQRKATPEGDGRSGLQTVLPNAGLGQPLDSAARSFFEPRLLADLSHVRVHRDTQASQSAKSLRASAYTVGHNIVFGEGNYRPDTAAGKQLLGHELVHVVQQSRAVGKSRPQSQPLRRKFSGAAERHIYRDADADVAGPVPKPPSDIDLGFNALDASHRLIESIDQSQIKIEDDPDDDSRFFKRKRLVRHVDFPAVVAVLNNLTADQVKEVEKEYLAYERRPLHYDLFGGGESHVWTDLTVDQIYRLKALMQGTRASSEEDAEAAAQHQREGDVAELHALLYGSRTGPEVERVMTLLRRPADEAAALIHEYDLNHDLRSDLLRLGLSNAIRAMLLLSGSSIAADAYAISAARNRIIEIDEELKILQPTKLSLTTALVILSDVATPAASIEHARKIEALKAERKTQVQLIEELVQQAAAEAKTEAEAAGKDILDTDTAIRTRVSLVLGTEGMTEAAVGGTSGKLIGAVATNQPAEVAAAQLRKLEEAGDLTTEAMANVFRSLRKQATDEAQRLYPDATADELKEEERKLSDQWFIHMRNTWDAAVVGDARTFSQILDRGDQTEVNLKRALYMASGRLGDADELVLALAGDRKDMETVKRVLRDKNADQIDDLRREYQRKTIQPPIWPLGRSLDFDLFGTAPTKVGEENPIDYRGGFMKPQGKASGTDRLLLEDYAQRPRQEGGIEEVNYIAGRAEREYEYTIDNRGATGWWRDHWGNEARSLLDATIKQVREKRDEYLKLVSSDPEAARSEKAHLIIRDMHFARATIRGDRAGYEKATAELRATFQAVASFVLQAVLTAVLTPFATALFAARLAQAGAMAARFAVWTKNTVVGMAATIGANKSVYGNDYDTDMLLRDLRGGLGSAIGATGVDRLLGPVTQRLTDRLGKTMAGEVIAGARTVGSMEMTAILDGEPANIFENFLEQHFLGKASAGITHSTTMAFKLGPKGAARGRTIEEPYTRTTGAGGAGELVPPRETAAESPAVDVDVPMEPPRVSMALEEPAAPKPREVNKHVVRRPTAASAAQTTEPPTNVPKPPAVTESAPPTKPAPPEGEPAIVPKAPGGDPAQEHTQVGGPRTRVTGTPTGTVVQDADPHDLVKAWKLYQQHIAADPSREVALLYNHALDQWAVVQGGPGSVPTPEGMRRLGWEVRDTTLGRHSHPVGPGGVTSAPNRLPSGRRGDLQLVRAEAARGEPSAAAHVTAIDVMVDRGAGPVPDRTFLFYDRRSDMWVVDYPVSGKGRTRERVSFVTMEQYRIWFEGQFHFSPDIPADVGPAGPHTPGGEKPPAPGEATAEPPGTEQSQARPAPTEELARVNAEVRRLTGGVGLKPIPRTPAALEESNRKVEAAKAVLARPDATPEDIRRAALDIAERAVAEFRARMLTDPESTTGALTAKELESMCRLGRDTSADAILSLIGDSPHPIIIERLQIGRLGIPTPTELQPTLSQRHGMVIMTLPDGTKILVDPTAAQFTARSRAAFTAEHMLSTVEGASLAATLLRDGMIVLTPETAPEFSRQYVMLLGADPSTAEGFATRLLAGDATILTETIVNGKISRESAHPAEAMDVMGADPNDPTVAESMRKDIATIPVDNPLRPLLEQLAKRFEVLGKPPIKKPGKK
jgi:hypothetical protein